MPASKYQWLVTGANFINLTYASHELREVNGGLSVQTDWSDAHFGLASSEGHEDDDLILRVFIETTAVEEVFDEVIGCLFANCFCALWSVTECWTTQQTTCRGHCDNAARQRLALALQRMDLKDLHDACTVTIRCVSAFFLLFNNVFDLQWTRVKYFTRQCQTKTTTIWWISTLSTGKCFTNIAFAAWAILGATLSFTAPAQNDRILMRTISPWSNSWIGFNSLTGEILKSTTPPPLG